MAQANSQAATPTQSVDSDAVSASSDGSQADSDAVSADSDDSQTAITQPAQQQAQQHAADAHAASAMQPVQQEVAGDVADSIAAVHAETLPQHEVCPVPVEEDYFHIYYDEKGDKAAAIDEGKKAEVMQRLAEHQQHQARPVRALTSLPCILREVRSLCCSSKRFWPCEQCCYMDKWCDSQTH